MVEAVNTVSVQKAPLRIQTQVATAAAPTSAPSAADVDFVTSQIYVDNLQNIAILQYRSSRTGEVVQQYPNQGQIDAFKRAEQAARPPATITAPAPTSDGGGVSVEISSAPAAPSTPASSTPAPAPTVSSGDSSGGSAAPSGSSVLV